MASSAKRFRRLDTTATSGRAAITVFSSPSAAETTGMRDVAGRMSLIGMVTVVF
jgi:hypothetical protein